MQIYTHKGIVIDAPNVLEAILDKFAAFYSNKVCIKTGVGNTSLNESPLMSPFRKDFFP